MFIVDVKYRNGVFYRYTEVGLVKFDAENKFFQFNHPVHNVITLNTYDVLRISVTSLETFSTEVFQFDVCGYPRIPDDIEI